ncbi:MAG TPA: glycosyltransferase family 39 protein [Pyrinomonadaceae bacterium]|nr:glycosyltransferase family 39 protein [Pyrinomonadaceae bacterium]
MRSAINQEAQECAVASLHQAGEMQTSITFKSSPQHVENNTGQAEGDEHERRAETDAGAFERFVSGNEWREPLCWTLVAFLLRLFLVWRFEQVISPDGVGYVTLGRSLIAGDLRTGLSPYSSPLYPLLIGLSSLIFHDAEFAGRFVSVVAGSLLVITSHRLTRRWYGKRVALIGACLVALHPLLIYYSTTLLTESTYTLLFTSGILTGWSALTGAKWRSYLLAGATFGACYLLKPEAAGFLLLLVGLTLGQKVFSRTGSYKTSARNALLLCAGFMLLAAPYLFYLRHQTGAWTLSGKTTTHLWQGSRLAGGDFKPVLLPLMPDSATVIVQLTKALRFEYEIFNLIFPPAFVLLVGLGLFRKRWTGNRIRRELYLLSFVAATLAGYAITLPNIRFLVPLLPILLCWLSNGVTEFAEWAAETVSGFNCPLRFTQYVRKLIVPLVIAGLLASLLPLMVYLLRGDKWDDYYGQKRAARWIKEHDASHAPVIMSTVPITAFYAEGRHVPLVDEDYAALIARARRERVDYLIVNERDFRYMSLRALLDDQSLHTGLRLAFDFAQSPGHKILVYAVEDSP